MGFRVDFLPFFWTFYILPPPTFMKISNYSQKTQKTQKNQRNQKTQNKRLKRLKRPQEVFFGVWGVCWGGGVRDCGARAKWGGGCEGSVFYFLPEKKTKLTEKKAEKNPKIARERLFFPEKIFENLHPRKPK